MSERDVTLRLNLRGNLNAAAQRNARSIERMSARSQRAMGVMRNGIAKMDSKFALLGNRYLALGSGVGLAAAAKGVIDFDKELTQLAVDARLTEEQTAKLKKQIFEVANHPDIKLDVDDLLVGIQQIVAKTGSIEVAQEQLENLGYSIRSTGAAAEDSGNVIAGYYKLFEIKTPEAMRQAISESIAMGKEGAIEFRDLATQINSAGAGFSVTGQKGLPAVRDFNALMQVIRDVSGSAPEVTTKVKRFISTITSEKAALLQKEGIQIWDAESLEKGVKIARRVPDIIRDILAATGGDPELLRKVFDQEAFDAVNAFAIEYRKLGKLPTLDSYLKVRDASGVEMLESARKNAGTAAAALQTLSNTFDQFADRELAVPLQELADVINSLDSEKVQDILQNTKEWALLLGKVYLAYKSIKVLNEGLKLAQFIKHGAQAVGGNKGAANALLQRGSSPANPLFVRDIGKIAGGTTAAAGATAASSQSKKFLDKATRYGGAAILSGLISYEVATALGADKLLKGTKAGDVVGEFIASFLSALGNEEARKALEINRKNNGYERRKSVREIRRGDDPVKVEIELTNRDQTTRVNTRTRNRNRRANVSVGTSMGDY